MTVVQRIWRFDWLSAVIATPLAVVLAWLVTSIIDRAAPIHYFEAFAVQTTAYPGGTIDIRFDVDRVRTCQVLNVGRYITDKDGVEHAVNGYTVSTDTRPGRESYSRTITIPDAVPAGPASYFLRIKYACNWLHNLGWPITVQSPNVSFELVEPPMIVLPPLLPPPEGDG